MKVESKIIGGMFGLENTQNLKKSDTIFLDNQNIFLVNARSGISLLVELLSPLHVWLPSYLCSSMLDAIDKHLTKIKFYEVDYNLNRVSLGWVNKIHKGDLVILIDYFGFLCDSSLMLDLKKQGAWILEDACQALLSEGVGQFSDFVLFSPRKFVGVPDGGILVLNQELDFNTITWQKPPPEWWLKTLSATIQRREFDIYGGNRHWFTLFQETENQCPIGHYTMSEFSKTLLTHAFDFTTITQKRINNYLYLINVLSDFAVIPDISPGVVPLGFPIRTKNRHQLRQILFEHQVFPPIHWPISNIVPSRFKDSHKLATEIMTLPCDQRYNKNDMNQIAQLILEKIK